MRGPNSVADLVPDSSLGGSGFAERLYRFFFAVVDLENCQQLGDLQQIANSLRESRQFNRTPGISRRDEQRHQKGGIGGGAMM